MRRQAVGSESAAHQGYVVPKTGAANLRPYIAKCFLEAGDSVKIAFFRDDGTSRLMHLDSYDSLEVVAEGKKGMSPYTRFFRYR